ncbi:unnamed protein product (macronuclear) [Paramecium tetraurelia]|uniref:Helicase ATP-binding domain-containing protein n=1 Tax=Paramecium tetraurelia TaxID=5888 RepID=A0DE87_PARTE|nr:uncharacterized protein GSPATT00016196001 [Paramecium tetraurelia]CAK81354.1 unnamed protein product [Paramecium tetraurelia]|eukprot:XP_001448751.1 hypothetical protein (macronuclear) [Paramecium tetraurelia strain d4-2]
MNQNIHITLIDEDSEVKQVGNSEIQINEELCNIQEKLNIENTEIYFPHKPYDVQVKYMESVVQILDKKCNGLLESPTGTGKTLSLLCSTMGWLHKHRKEQQKSGASSNLKIIYASRTHAQLKQVAQELKRTVYAPNISMVGSRDQYCLLDFSNLKGNALIQACRRLVKRNKCQFYNKDSLPNIAAQNSKLINTLEESKQFGHNNNVCPYYFERERLTNADLILLPYNYLLDREFSNIVNTENSIIIFDEAHNVPSAAENGQSFFINETIVQEAKKELERWLKELYEMPDFFSGFQQVLNQKKLSSLSLREYEDIVQTIGAFSIFLQNLQGASYFDPQQTNDQCKVFDAEQIFNFLYENTSINKKNGGTIFSNGINGDNISLYISFCVAIITYMSETSPHDGSNFHSWIRFVINLYNLDEFDDYLDDDEQLQYFDFYKLAIIKNIQNQISLNMWCLDPSLAFKKLKLNNICSIIFTSGTLAPMESWQSELQMEFKIQLSNKHVIDIANNVRAFQHLSFDFSYQKRENEDQIINLGLAILNFSKVIKGGIIIVFSSYGLMQNIRRRWANQQLIQRLNEVKKCLWEEQGSAQFHNTLEVFKQNGQKGAILFAVHRGKVTEGIDLSDDLCRAVFLIGIPYPPLKDQKIKLKKQFLDQQLAKNRQGLTSKDWYMQQAVRATNQAIGRVIRHINDYGVIFFCDRRFLWSNMKNSLSKWVQPAIQSWKNDEDVLFNLKNFFQRQTQQQNLIKQTSNQQDNQIFQEQERKNIFQETQKYVYQQFKQSSDVQPPNTIPSKQQQNQIEFKDYLITENKKQRKRIEELSDEELIQFLDEEYNQSSDQWKEDFSNQEMEEQSQSSEELLEESQSLEGLQSQEGSQSLEESQSLEGSQHGNNEESEGNKIKKIKYNKSNLNEHKKK